MQIMRNIIRFPRGAYKIKNLNLKLLLNLTFNEYKYLVIL